MTHNLMAAWQSGRTVRKHTMHVHRRENTAEHTWGMLMLLEKYIPQGSVRLRRRVVTHDMGEAGACDIPAHVCWANPALKDHVQGLEDAHVALVMGGPHAPALYAEPLEEDESAAVEVLDRAEFVLGCWYELSMGNSYAAQPIQRAIRKLTETLAAMDENSPLYNGLRHLSADLRRTVEWEARFEKGVAYSE